jgi:lipid II:glycine glycyltransferase (peptidoglycan interpeptide bridge formation enzyme)
VDTITNRDEWNTLAAGLPGAHILQSWEWGAFKSRWGWSAERLVWDGGRAAAQVLTRRGLRGLVRIMYVPRGPLLDWADQALAAHVLADLEAKAAQSGAIQIKIDPDLPLARGPYQAEIEHAPGVAARATLVARGWQFSPTPVQFRNTVVLDLTPNEEALLAGFKQKTRYNIRLAAKKGVTLRAGRAADLDLLYRLYAETAARDGFLIRPQAYYLDIWRTLLEIGHAQPLIAEVDGEPVSALMLFVFGQTAWYFYGMSTGQQRDKMPNHLLQWEAIRWAKAHACTRYDLWGAPEDFAEHDSLWGVWRFKEGFNGQVSHGLGAWDYAPRPWLNKLFLRFLGKKTGG